MQAPSRRPHHGAAGWAALAALLCLPTVLPLAVIVAGTARADGAVLDHLLQYVLPAVAANSAWLVLAVGACCVVLGTLLAALVALTEFPGRRAFAPLLVLPLAIPGYVMAVGLIGLFDWGGPIATPLRAAGWTAWPEFRSLGGLTLTLAFSLYPYVYLLARGAFATQGAQAIEAARALGMSPPRAFLRAALPMARPWIAAGTLLVLMETLADFGTVAAFNYDTFTMAIYKAWFAMFSIDSALALAGVLLLCVLGLIVVERRSRRAQRYHRSGRVAARLDLGRWRWAATAVCSLVVLLAFTVPVCRLLWIAVPHLASATSMLLDSAGNSLLLALAGAFATVLVAAALAAIAHAQPAWWSRLAVRVGTLGYGLPGALLAVGLYVPLTRALNWLADAVGWSGAAGGGLAILLLAYVVRFTAVGHAPVDAAWQRLRPATLEAARSLGVGRWRRITQVHVPLLRGGLLTAALLVGIDIMKEMPITLMTRPFGWDTLATRVFEFSNEGQWAQAAVPALLVVAVGLLPVLWLERRMDNAA